MIWAWILSKAKRRIRAAPSLKVFNSCKPVVWKQKPTWCWLLCRCRCKTSKPKSSSWQLRARPLTRISISWDVSMLAIGAQLSGQADIHQVAVNQKSYLDPSKPLLLLLWQPSTGLKIIILTWHTIVPRGLTMDDWKRNQIISARFYKNLACKSFFLRVLNIYQQLWKHRSQIKKNNTFLWRGWW